MIRPLDRIGAIKLKLGLVIFGAVVATVLMLIVGVELGWSRPVRVLVATAVALAFVQFLSRGMTSPLREMAAAARAMARGDYDRRVRATSRDEVGELARAFNAMAADLAAADRMRRDLVANVSHELRTPIGALQAVLENLVDGVGEPDPETVRSMLRQTQRLGRMVEQLLDLSKLEGGVLQLRRTTFPLEPLLRATVADAVEARRASTGSGGDVVVTVSPPSLVLTADAERVQQVVTNLVDNALRHSPAGRPVRVSASEAAGGVVLEVVDEGPGIPAGETERIFERFHRLDPARSADAGGAGLGLAITRWVVDLHGGSIRTENGSPTGCRMVVELPKEQP